MTKNSPLADKLKDVKDRIAIACAKAKRDVADVTLIAVTKTAVPEQIREIADLGITDLGESRAQQLVQRAAQLQELLQRRKSFGGTGTAAAAPKVRWHMIGHLQRNKIKMVLPYAGLIHSVDTLRLAEELDEMGRKESRRIPVLMEINASEETQKYGVAVGAAVPLAEQIADMPGLELRGLMCMGPLNADEARARAVFARTREIFEEIQWQKIGGTAFRHLSMGMSGDFEAGILEGATLVRIGTALFGEAAPGSEEADET